MSSARIFGAGLLFVRERGYMQDKALSVIDKLQALKTKVIRASLAVSKKVSFFIFVLQYRALTYAGWFDKTITIKSEGESIDSFTRDTLSFGVNVLRVIGLFTFLFGFIKALDAKGRDDPHALSQGTKMAVAGLMLIGFGTIMNFLTGGVVTVS